MNRKMKVALAVAAGLAAIGVAVAAPALAGPGPGGADRPAPERSLAGWHWHDGRGPGHGPVAEPGDGWRDGTCRLLPDQPAGELTAAQAATLTGLAEQQKLARDLYQEFAQRYDVRVFDQVAAAAQRQLAAVRTLLERHQLADPADGQAAGQFTSPQVQASYDQLSAAGSADLAAALAAARTVAQEQVSELAAAGQDAGAADLTVAYEHLLAAAQRQLARFEAWSGS